MNIADFAITDLRSLIAVAKVKAYPTNAKAVEVIIPTKLAYQIQGYLDQERPVDVWQKWGVLGAMVQRGSPDFALEYNDPVMDLTIFVNGK